MPRPERSSSKALPVIVATGLAVGVFSGLLLVRGTGEAQGNGGTTSPVVAKADAGVAKPPDGNKPPDGTKPEGPEAKAADAGAAGAAADAGAATPDAKPPKVPEVVEPKVATLTFTVEPEDADAEITVDDDKVDGTSYEMKLEDGRKAVKIVVRARGYRPFVKRLVVKGDQTVQVAMRKRSSGGGSSQPRPSKPKGPGGLIDL